MKRISIYSTSETPLSTLDSYWYRDFRFEPSSVILYVLVLMHDFSIEYVSAGDFVR